MHSHFKLICLLHPAKQKTPHAVIGLFMVEIRTASDVSKDNIIKLLMGKRISKSSVSKIGEL